MGSRNEAVHAVSFKLDEIVTFNFGPAEAVAQQRAVPVFSEGILKVRGEFAKKGKAYGGQNNPNDVGVPSKKSASNFIGAVVELRHGVRNLPLCLITKVSSAVENSRDSGRRDACFCRDVGYARLVTLSWH